MSNFFSRSHNDMQYLFVKSAKLSKKNKRKKNRAIATVAGLVLIVLQLVTMIMFLLQILKLDILPMKYLIMLNVILVLVLLYNFTAQFTNAHIWGKFISVVLTGVMVFGFFFSSKVNASLSKVSKETTTRVDTVNIVVLSTDSASSIKDTVKYTYGYNSSINNDILVKAIDDINADYNATIETKDYTDWDDLLKALYSNHDVKAIAMVDSMYTSLNEQYSDFKDKTKIVGTVAISSEVKLSASEKKVNEEPFIIYLSGTDSENGVEGCEGVTLSGHSDVNILAVCNPITRQILLVSTPRDSYVTIKDASGHTGLDKLTHASNAGIEYSIDALNRMYGVTPDYYVRINFTGCVSIVDALGGITVNSSVDFTNGTNAWYEQYHFNKGLNDLNGDQTIAFVRERMAFINGDFQRGKNQEAALKGIINKATSPAILSSYSSVLDSISDVMLTNMPTSTITALVKGQLSNDKEWNIQSYSIEGTTDTRTGQVYGLAGMSVVIPDTNSINCAIQLMSKITNGDEFNVDDFVSEYMGTSTETSAGSSSSSDSSDYGTSESTISSYENQ